MGRSTNHSENLKTNPHFIYSRLNRMRNLHLERRNASVTKLLVSLKMQ